MGSPPSTDKLINALGTLDFTGPPMGPGEGEEVLEGSTQSEALKAHLHETTTIMYSQAPSAPTQPPPLSMLQTPPERTRVMAGRLQDATLGGTFSDHPESYVRRFLYYTSVYRG